MKRREFINLAGGAAVAAGVGVSAGRAGAKGGGVSMRAVDGQSVRVSSGQIAVLGLNLRGRIIEPGALDYDSARTIWNARIDHFPGVIVRAAHTSDIVEAVNFARVNGVELSVRAGGHNHAGYSVSEGGVMLDLTELKAISPDFAKKRVAAAPGLTFAEFDATTHRAGLATTGPIVSMVGLPGYTLGGGIGWLHRKFGAGCDNLAGAEIVLASGDIVRADQDENADLLWALRGGGGNFGVASKLDFQLHPLAHVYAGLMFYGLDDLESVGGFIDSYLDDAPDDLNIWMLHRLAPPSPALPTNLHGRPVLIVAVTWTGSEEAGARMVAPVRKFKAPLADLVRWRPYPEWQGALDGAWGDGFCNEWVGGYLDRYDGEVQRVVEDFTRATSSPFSDFKLARLGGAFGRQEKGQTAFGFRGARYAYVIQTRWRVADDNAPHLEWTRRFHDRMRAFDNGGVYANFIGKDEPADRHREAYEQTTHQRLQRIKSATDPDNMFRRNVNIKPA